MFQNDQPVVGLLQLVGQGHLKAVEEQALAMGLKASASTSENTCAHARIASLILDVNGSHIPDAIHEGVQYGEI